MKRILITLFLLILAGCLVQPDLPVEAQPPTKNSSELIESQLPAPSPTSDMSELSPRPTAQLPQGTKGKNDHLTLLEKAVRDLSFRLDVDLNTVAVISMYSVDWPDGGLGCPLPGLDYPQAITPGYKILLEAKGEIYIYHTNTELAFWLCLDGAAQLPKIPVVPGEIDDGIPWMPVDPVPTLADEIIIADPDPVK